MLTGEGTDQLQKLATEGRVDRAADIAVRATIDCIVGAVPGAAFKNVVAKAAHRVADKIKSVIKAAIRTLWG